MSQSLCCLGTVFCVMVMNGFVIYTDGACSGNPGVGGWGAVISSGDGCKEISGYEDYTTNNRMELRAAIEALKIIGPAVNVILYTDSQYTKMGITVWIKAWRSNNWTLSNKKPVKNADLWRELDSLNEMMHIDWRWVKGHANNSGNNRADFLATEAIKKRKATAYGQSL